MKRLCSALVLAGCVLAHGPAPQAQGKGLGNVNGTVTTEAGEPLSGVDIKIMLTGGSALEGRSDSSGKWSVNGVGKGEFHAQFSKEGFPTKRVKLVIEKEALRTEPVKIVMKR